MFDRYVDWTLRPLTDRTGHWQLFTGRCFIAYRPLASSSLTTDLLIFFFTGHSPLPTGLYLLLTTYYLLLTTYYLLLNSLTTYYLLLTTYYLLLTTYYLLLTTLLLSTLLLSTFYFLLAPYSYSISDDKNVSPLRDGDD